MDNPLLIHIYICVLAAFAGFEVIAKVPAMLHTPLMSGANAISGIALIGALVVAGPNEGLVDASVSTVLGLVAVFLATINVVGGFMVTERMLKMFKRRPR